MKQKTYRGFRDANGTAHVEVNGKPLPLRLEIANHSPTGFEWGYGGSGPAQLALAILVDVTGNARQAVREHQKFKFRVIGRLERDREWTMTDHTVREYLKQRRAA